MLATTILFMRIGYEEESVNCIKEWKRSDYNDIAVLMGLNPKNYKNKIEIHKALGAELPHYLEENPNIKAELKEQLEGSEHHYLYDMVNT